MIKSKSLIEKQLRRKTNLELVKTLISTKKKAGWLEVGSILARPKRNRLEINLDKLDSAAEEGKTNVVPGKVLSQGVLSKKLNVCALAFSERAKEKILNAGGKVCSIDEEIKSNPEGKNIKIINNLNVIK